MTQDPIELKPCPFCGSTDVGEDVIIRETHSFRCRNCGARTCNFTKEEDAKEMWNTRAEQNSPQASGASATADGKAQASQHDEHAAPVDAQDGGGLIADAAEHILEYGIPSTGSTVNDKRFKDTIIRALERAGSADEDLFSLIDERDAAEDLASKMYYLITGKSPEWSNLFGYAEAITEVNDAQTALRKAAQRPAPDYESYKIPLEYYSINDIYKQGWNACLEHLHERGNI